MIWRPVSELRSEVVSIETFRSTRPTNMKAQKEMQGRTYVLPTILPTLERLDATWCYKNFGYQFKFTTGPILCWWPRTGAVYWQGKNLSSELADTSVEEALETLDYAIEHPEKSIAEETSLRMADLLEKPVCLVCGDDGTKLLCETCAQLRDDLCNECWKFAHWCTTPRINA